MTDKQHDIFIKAVEESIKKTVNGKIDGMRNDLNNYILDDTKWKKDNESALANMKNLTGAWKILLGLAVAVGAISGAILGIKKLFL